MSTAGWRGWNTAAYFIMVIANVLANVVPFGGRTTGEVSAMFSVPITPAPYAFSIWWAIYLLLGAFVLLQWRPGWSGMSVFRRIGPWFVVSCGFNVAWLLCWHFLFIRSSVFLMLGLLLTLIHLYRLTRRVDGSPRDDAGLSASLFVQLPFSLYTAWISVAAAVNVLAGLRAHGLAGWYVLGTYWSLLALALAAGAALLVFARRRDTAYVLTVAWAFVAIGVQQQSTAPAVAWTSWLLAAALLLVALRLVPAPRLRGAVR